MKILKNLLVFFIIFVIIVPVTACSSSGKTATTETTASKTTAVATTAAPAIDMKGETIKILSWGEKSPADPSTEEGDLTLKRQQELEKKYNTKIVWEMVPWGKSLDMMTAAKLSGEPCADVVLMEYEWAFPTMAAQGYFLPVDDLFNFDDPKWPSDLRKLGSYNGKMYGIRTSTGAATGIYYNREILKREGLTDPQELVAKDQWNWDAFLNITKTATKDLNGDGNIDQWGLVGYAPILARNWIYSNNGKIVDNVDGKINFTAGEPNSIEALRFIYDLVHKYKVMMPNVNGNFEDYNESQKVFNSGKAAMVSGEIWEGATRKDMTDEYGFVWYPKGPKAQNYSNVVTNFSMWFLPANSKHPKEVAKIFDELQLWDRIEKNEKQSIELSMRNPVDVQMALDMSKKVNVLYYSGIGDLEQQFFGAVKSFTMSTDTPESAIEKFKGPAQNLIDSIMSKTK